jgi:predicted DNA-binding transcriptional regulator YafY
MPINKHALIRYKTIDQCLQNRFRKWTLEDLMEACSDALYEYEGITKGISKRAIQLDIQNMRSEKLGYNAPIVVTDKKFYSYEEKNYSITNIPVTAQDLGTLNEVIEVLKQFKGFGYFDELSSMVTRLEDKVISQKPRGRAHILFEKNELLKGLHFIDPLHKFIIQQTTIEISYQSFKARAPRSIVFFPYLLKEYRNRWFVFGKNSSTKDLMVLALDRIEAIEESNAVKFQKADFNVLSYFDDMLGVTRNANQQPQTVVLKIHRDHAPYVITKPLHSSQKVLKRLDDGTIFSIDVLLNFELEREILGFGAHIEVLGPRKLRSRIKSIIKQSLSHYETSEQDKTVH